jgi:hypothetical protein
VATRKQRRRRAKEKRHEYEVVYLDSEGNEVEPEEVAPSKAAKSPARGTSNAKSASSSKSKSKSKFVREPKPPSWPRAIRRGAIFMPILIAVVLITNRNNATPLGIALVAIVFTALVIPFGYFTDHLAWRAFHKRQGGKPAGKSAKR